MKENQLRIKVNNADEYRKALVLFYEIGGYKFPKSYSIEEYIEKYPFRNAGEVVGIDKGYLDSWYAYGNHHQTQPTPFNETSDIINFLVNKVTSITITVKDVGDYTAIVTKNGIEVGCQNISLEKFDELSEAVKKVRG